MEMKMHRILIIEDEKIVAREIKDYLMPEFHADVANNLTESLLFIRNFHYAVIITDLNLGGREAKGGKAAIAEIRKVIPLTNIIVYSACEFDSLKENKNYIFKFIPKEKLTEDLKKLKPLALLGLKKYEEDIKRYYYNQFEFYQEIAHLQTSNLITNSNELKSQEREQSNNLTQYSRVEKKTILKNIAIKNPEDALDIISNQPDLPKEYCDMASLCKARLTALKKSDTLGKIDMSQYLIENNKIICSIFEIINML